MKRVLSATACLFAAAGAAWAQEPSSGRWPLLIEVRVGTTEMLGGPGRTLIGPDDAIGMTGAVQASPRFGVWLSADYRPSNSSRLYPGPGLSPAVSLYALTLGVSRRFGPEVGRMKLRPIELGLGAGATLMTAEARNSQFTMPPPGAQPEAPLHWELLESRQWDPTAVARLRLAIPLGRVARLSATAGVAATHVGDVRLWNGQWSTSPDGTRYHASSQVWRYGTIVVVPITFGLGAEF